MKFWGISLEGTNRRQRFVDHMFQRQIDVDIIDAWPGAASGVTTHIRYDQSKGRLSSGYIGLNISWYATLTAALHSDDDVHVIMEDDVELCRNFKTKAAHYIANAPPGWDVLYLGSCCTNGKPRERINFYFDRVRYPLCTHCLVVHRKVIPMVRRAMMQCWKVTDQALESLVFPEGIGVYVSVPHLVETRKDLPQTIHDLHESWETVSGWFDFPEIYEEWSKLKEGIIVEIGSWMGRSAAYMAQKLIANGSQVDFFCVDTWKGSNSDPGHFHEIRLRGGTLFYDWCENMARCGVIHRVIPVMADSANAAVGFQNGSINRLFIDGDHLYESVCRDIRAYLPKMHPTDAVMAGHDFERKPVRRAVLETLKDRNVEAISERSWICDMRT